MAKTETTTAAKPAPKPAPNPVARRRIPGRVAAVYGAIGCLLIGLLLSLDLIGVGHFRYFVAVDRKVIEALVALDVGQEFVLGDLAHRYVFVEEPK